MDVNPAGAVCARAMLCLSVAASALCITPLRHSLDRIRELPYFLRWHNTYLFFTLFNKVNDLLFGVHFYAEVQYAD